MFYFPVLIGTIFGALLFTFIFIASKKSGRRYMAPVITFLAVPSIFVYSLFFLGGFEGMAYGLLSIGFLVSACIGTVFMKYFLHTGNHGNELSRRDISSLVLLPILFIGIIGSLFYFDKNYWIIEEGTLPMSENSLNTYSVSTILEGRKMVTIQLGEKYEGKRMEVDKVTKIGATTVVLKIVDEGKPNERPYIKVGIDSIKEPLRVETTDGVVIGPDK